MPTRSARKTIREAYNQLYANDAMKNHFEKLDKFQHQYFERMKQIIHSSSLTSFQMLKQKGLAVITERMRTPEEHGSEIQLPCLPKSKTKSIYTIAFQGYLDDYLTKTKSYSCSFRDNKFDFKFFTSNYIKSAIKNFLY